MSSTSKDKKAAKRFAQLAIQKSFVSKDHVKDALQELKDSEDPAGAKQLGAKLVELGYLAQPQCDDLLKKLKEQQKTEAKQEKKKKRKVGDFELLSRIGKGGMGDVYKARQVSIDREIALKILPPDLAKDPEFRERFLREARAVAKLNHPNIVAGIDVGESKGVYYFAMEFVDGKSLGDRLEKNEPIPENEALEYTRQTALALSHAHANGFFHRDVKPDNILIDSTGTAKLADLGLARSRQERTEDFDSDSDTDEPEDAGLTRKGKVVGTPYYISPEQARGKTDLTPATDLYSLGASLFHMLTGRRPYKGSTPGSIMKKHVRSPVPDPRERNPKLSKQAAEICIKLMQKEPEERYSDGQGLAKAIQKVQEEREPKKPAKKERPSKIAIAPPVASASKGPSSNTRLTRPVRRKETAGGSGEVLIAVAVLAGIVMVGFLFSRGGSSDTGQTRDKKEARSKPDKYSPRPRTPTKTIKRESKSPTRKIEPRPAHSETPPVIERVTPEPTPAVALPDLTPEKEDPPEKAVVKEETVSRREQERQLLTELSKALSKADYEKAKSAVKKFLEDGKRVETAQFGGQAVGEVMDLDTKWQEARKKLKGQVVRIRNINGTITNVTEVGFELQIEDGPTVPTKWDAVAAGDRLRLMGYLPDDANTKAQQGLYRYMRGDTLVGARMLLDAEKAKIIVLPETWREEFEKLHQAGIAGDMKADMQEIAEFDKKHDWLRLKGKIASFRTKYGESGKEYEENLTALVEKADKALAPPEPKPEPKKDPEVAQVDPEPKAPDKPVAEDPPAKKLNLPPPPKDGKAPSPAYLASLFSGGLRKMSGVPGHVQVVYNFSRPEHLKDFTQHGGGEWKFIPGIGVEFKPGKGAVASSKRRTRGSQLVHKARWMGLSSFTGSAQILVMDDGGSFGMGIESQKASGKSVTISLGVSSASMTFSQNRNLTATLSQWNTQTNRIYECILKREYELWVGRAGPYRGTRFADRVIGKRKRKALPGEWPGHGFVHSSSRPIIVKKVVLQGLLEYKWLVEAAKDR